VSGSAVIWPHLATAAERAGLAVGLLMLAMFGLAIVKRDNSVVDVAWGPSFVLIALAASTTAPQLTVQLGLVVMLVTIWGARLAWHIGSRRQHQPGEDWRYAAWRKAWGRWWPIKSLTQVFALQGVLALLASAPVFVLVAAQPHPVDAWTVIGTLVWTVGFAIEAIGDWQLAQFLADRRAGRAHGRFCTRGLWSRTRHPNYLGEAILWWGIAIIALGVPAGWIGCFGALVVTLLVRFVSGVPLQERHWRSEPDFDVWAARTPIFLPRLW
jgi:steroid 5-alpha reductase family enzyme